MLLFDDCGCSDGVGGAKQMQMFFILLLLLAAARRRYDIVTLVFSLCRFEELNALAALNSPCHYCMFLCLF